MPFECEINCVDWTHFTLKFLDAVSFDNRGMLRKRGYALKVIIAGISSRDLLFQHLTLWLPCRGKSCSLYRVDFPRMPRTSLHCFIGCEGLSYTFMAEGTFDRSRFMDCCLNFALSQAGHTSIQKSTLCEFLTARGFIATQASLITCGCMGLDPYVCLRIVLFTIHWGDVWID